MADTAARTKPDRRHPRRTAREMPAVSRSTRAGIDIGPALVLAPGREKSLAPAPSVDLLRRDRTRRRRSRLRRHGHGRRRRRRVPRARRLFAVVADSRARMVVRSARRRSMPRSSAQTVARAVAARAVALRRRAHRRPARARRIRRAARRHCRSLRRRRRVAMPVGRRRALARSHRGGTDRGHRRHAVRVRALGRGSARARGAAGAHRRDRRRSSGNRGHRPRTASTTASTSSRGQKTGFYLDQRDNRHIVRRHAAAPARAQRLLLHGRLHAGGACRAAPRSVVSIDSSADALALARDNLARNAALDAARAAWTEADVFAELRRLRDAGATFDLIVLDPPKFAPTAAHAERAARAYKDINLLAFKLLAPGGLLATFSCSGGVSADLFQKIVAGAALDAKADGADHRAPHRQRRPSGGAEFPGRRLPQGPADPQGLIHAVCSALEFACGARASASAPTKRAMTSISSGDINDGAWPQSGISTSCAPS